MKAEEFLQEVSDEHKHRMASIPFGADLVLVLDAMEKYAEQKQNDIELVDGMCELLNRDRIHQINKDLDYQKELNIKQKHIENLESQIIDLKIDLEHYKKVAQDMSKF